MSICQEDDFAAVSYFQHHCKSFSNSRVVMPDSVGMNVVCVMYSGS